MLSEGTCGYYIGSGKQTRSWFICTYSHGRSYLIWACIVWV